MVNFISLLRKLENLTSVITFFPLYPQHYRNHTWYSSVMRKMQIILACRRYIMQLELDVTLRGKLRQ